MVTTLIKHDFIRTRALLFTATGIALIMGAVLALSTHLLITLGGGASSGSSANAGPGLATVTWVFGLVLTFGFLPLVQLWLGVDLYRSSFSRRGYFVQTLPMTGSAVLSAKYLWALIVTAFALVVALLLGAMTMLGTTAIYGWTFANIWEIVLDLIGTANFSAGAWLIMIVFAVTYLLQGVIQYYFCVTFGSEAWINKLGAAGPILVWVGLYIVMQLLGLLSLVIPGALIIGDGQTEFAWVSFFGQAFADHPTPNSAEGIPVLPVAIIGVMLLAFVVMIWRSYVSAGRKVDLR